MNRIKILIADDHAVVRKGLVMILEEEPNLEVVGEASDGQEAVEKVELLRPDIVFMDISMPQMSGLEAIGIIHKRFPSVKSLIFSMHHNTDYIMAAVENGADGYLLKDTSKQEIISAIDALSRGERYFPPTISSVIVSTLVNKPQNRAITGTGHSTEQPKSLLKISKKERVILKMIADGLNSREIADRLQLSIRTVSNHRANIIKKTKARNTAELVKIAVQEDKI
jgi:DNA-binding NarL/FixJ family response regulator